MQKNILKKITTVFFTLLLSIGYVYFDFGVLNKYFDIGITVLAADGRLYDQRSDQWVNVIHGTGHLSGAGIYDSGYSTGCGIFSFCNAIYALNDIALDPVSVADWAYSIGAYNKYGADGTNAVILYNNIEERYGKELNITMNGYFNIGHIYDGRLLEHLNNGGVAIGHVKDHYIAITGYDSSTNSFKVIDSFVTNARGLPACGWVSADMLNGNNTDSQVFWVALIGKSPSSSDINVNNLYIPNIMTVGDKATITGTVSSGLDLTSVSLRIDNADQIGDLNNYQLSVSQTVSGKYFDLSSLGVDLSTFKPGVYKVTGSASNTDHSEMIISSVITILSNYDTGKSGTYVFRSTVNPSYVIGTGSDNNVQLVSYADTADRTWYAEYFNDGYYTIKNCASGLYLDIYSGGTDAGSNIWQYEGNQSYAQQWQILQSGSSYYLIPRCSLGCAADIDYGVMADGTNITIYYTDLYLNENQRFILDNSACSFYRPGHKVTFDANGGTLPNSSMDWSEFTVSGINTGRDTGSLIVYNIPGMTVNTNAYGYEAQVDKTGKVTALRLLNDNSQLTVPDGGMVISGHFSGGNDGGTFVSTIAVGNYVGFDPDTNKVYVYRSEEEYTAHNKCVADGSVYGFLPTPSRYGYVFEGWYTSPVGGERITEYTVYSTDSLYAHWAKPTVSVFGDYTYTGQPIIPDIIVSVGDTVLINGTDYIIYYDKNTNAGTATYTVSAVSGGRYSFPDITGTFTINKAKATVSSAPKAINGLKYNGKEQELITAGTALNSLIAYSFDGITYSDKIPSATEAGTYTIYYKALGYGNNYTDSDAVKLTVTIEESNELIKSISVRSQYLYVIYGYSGSDEISRRVNVAFNDVTDDMIDWMYKNDPSCGLLADFVNAFSPSEQSIILTAPELRAIEYVLNNDF